MNYNNVDIIIIINLYWYSILCISILLFLIVYIIYCYYNNVQTKFKIHPGQTQKQTDSPCFVRHL